MRTGRVIIAIKDGNIAVNRQISNLNLNDIGLLISNLEIVKNELVDICRELIKKQQEGEK